MKTEDLINSIDDVICLEDVDRLEPYDFVELLASARTALFKQQKLLDDKAALFRELAKELGAEVALKEIMELNSNPFEAFELIKSPH